MSDFNDQVIAEFRANDGKVAGPFQGAPIVLVHHRGRKTGTERVAPLVYLPNDSDPDVIYIFASKAGAPTNPDWYYNLTASAATTVEVGTQAYPVRVDEVTGAERDRLYAEQVTRMPGFADYEKTAAGRTIPVLALRRTKG